jgi:hypothetical protein
MPTGLKTTSSPLQISSQLRTTAPSGSDLFLSKQIDLQLNPLDNEVFVVTGLKIDFITPTLTVDTTNEGQFNVFQRCSLSKTELTAFRGIDSNTVIGASDVNSYVRVQGSVAQPPITVEAYNSLESNAMDAPPATQDYLDIIATNDYYINFSISDLYVPAAAVGVNVRLYGYRATASSSVYAALVQSEMLSS